MEDLFVISITASAVILLIFLLTPVLDKRYSASWKYLVWLILALRLIIPFRPEINTPPILIPKTDGIVVLRSTGSSPVEIYTDNFYIKKGNNSPHSADYAPVMTVDELIFNIWKIGFSIILLMRFGSYFIFRLRIKKHLVKEQGNIFRCSRLSSPMLIGFFRPIIILPDMQYSDKEYEMILRHEQTHQKRYDLWYKLVLTLAQAMHWFNPVIHIMVKKANRDLEYSCDDLVIKNTDSEYKKEYAMTILKVMRGGNDI